MLEPAVAAERAGGSLSATASEEGLESGGPFGAEESFESAASPPPAPLEPPNDLAHERDAAAAPSLSAARARIPETTRRLLSELFRADVTAVRRLSRDQLR